MSIATTCSPSSAATRPRRAWRAAAGSPRAFAAVEVFDTLAAARDAWDEIARTAPASPYQRFAFVRQWLETIGAARRVTPMIVVARDAASEVAALLPLGTLSYRGLRLAAFLGGKDTNYNLGLFRPGPVWSLDEIRSLLAAAAQLTTPGVDAFLLVNQPTAWEGAPHPLAVLPSQPSLGAGYKSVLPDDFSLWFDSHLSKKAQKKLRNKVRHLELKGPILWRRVDDAPEIERVLAAFHAQKSARLGARRITNAYEESAARQFLRELALSDAAGGRSLELHALSVGERIVATFGGLPAGDRISGLFVSFDGDPEIAQSSPGNLIIQAVIRDAIARGFKTFDLGAGDARYKLEVCETEERLVDSAFAVTVPGRLASLLFLAKQRMKRRVKDSPRLAAWFARLEPRVRS